MFGPRGEFLLNYCYIFQPFTACAVVNQVLNWEYLRHCVMYRQGDVCVRLHYIFIVFMLLNIAKSDL